ncbi:MAG TPA: RDD family protein [Acidobacteriota bacterium]|nr:RDD family protein [Acidobacteriota bacterium]
MISTEAASQEYSYEDESDEFVPEDESDESQHHSGLIEVDYSEGEAKEEQEEKPAWRQELTQRLQAIKQKREAMDVSTKTQARDLNPPVPIQRPHAVQPPIPAAARSSEAMPVSKQVPKTKGPQPKQKTLQPLDLGLSDKPASKEPAPRDVQALIDDAVSGKSAQPAGPVIDAGYSDSSPGLPSDDEGKLILLSRTLSGLVDLIVVMLCSGVCLIAADFFSGIISLDAVSYLIFAVLFLLIYFFYSLFFLAASNQTIGMMITDLRVVDADGRRPSVSQLLRRCFGYLASLLVLGLGLLWSLFDRESQCFHDRISDTRIVRYL